MGSHACMSELNQPKDESSASNGSSVTTERLQKPQLYRPGTSGNPRGRPKGSRHRVTEAMTALYADSVEQHGEQTIELLRQRDPATWARLAMVFIPRKLESALDLTITNEMAAEYESCQTYADRFRVAQKARALIGAAPLIDITPEAEPEGGHD
jgi:hypothetical protein